MKKKGATILLAAAMLGSLFCVWNIHQRVAVLEALLEQVGF